MNPNNEVLMASTATAPSMIQGWSEIDTSVNEPQFKEVLAFPIIPEYRMALMKLPTTSARIRKMSADGYTRTQISETLDIIYQHVRNVLTQKVKRPITLVQPVMFPSPMIKVPVEQILTVNLSQVDENAPDPQQEQEPEDVVQEATQAESKAA